MGKGVLLELTGRQAVVLTPQGEFKRVPKPKGTCDIGDEIEFAEAQQPAWTRWGMIAAAAVMLLVAPAGYNMWADAQPVAIVTVDINPSLELTLNRKDAVLQARPLNEDGALVLEGVEWNRKPVDDVLTAVTTRAVEEHKLDPASDSATVLVSVAPAKEDLPKSQADRVRDKSYDAITVVAGEANVAVYEVNKKEKAEAEAEGLNPSKFILKESLEEKGIPVEPDALKKTGPGKYLKELGVSPSEIFSESQKEHGGEPASKAKEKDKDKEDSKSRSDKSNGTPALPTVGQPANSGKSDDKGAQQKDDKQKDDKKSDDKKSDDKGGQQKDDKQSDDQKSDDKKADVKPGGNNGNKGGPAAAEPVKPGSDKQAPKHEEKQAQPKGNEKKEQGKKSSWTIPFFGIEIEKPSFLQDKESKESQSTDAAAEPRANTPGGGASGEEDNGQKVEEKQENGSQGGQKEKPEDKPNKQEKPSGGNQSQKQNQNDKGNSGKK